MKLIRNGPQVGARIFMRLGMLAAEINGQAADPDQVWHAGDQIDEDEYNLLVADPPIDPWQPLLVSGEGIAERIREAEEGDWWFARNYL